MSASKVTENKTGILFYSKVKEGAPLRIRFRSFQQSLLENREAQEELSQMQANYNYFKYGRSQTRKHTQSGQRQSAPKLYKNMKDRCRDSEELRTRLRSMRDNRRSIFERIKLLKE